MFRAQAPRPATLVVACWPSTRVDDLVRPERHDRLIVELMDCFSHAFGGPQRREVLYELVGFVSAEDRHPASSKPGRHDGPANAQPATALAEATTLVPDVEESFHVDCDFRTGHVAEYWLVGRKTSPAGSVFHSRTLYGTTRKGIA